MRLRTALRIEDGEVVAVVADHYAFSRVNALFRLADDIVEAGGRVITTTTLPIPIADIQHAPSHVSAFEANRARVEAALRTHPHLLITGPVDHTLGRAAGVSLGLIEDLQAVPNLAAILVATDSAIIPPSATRVVVAHPSLGSNDVALPNASVAVDVVYGDVVADELLPRSRHLADDLLRETLAESVLIGDTRKPNAVREVWARVGAVVLAAGRSTRMGQSKQLMPWGNNTLLGEVVRRLCATGVHDIVIVTGAEREAVERVVSEAAQGDARIRCVFNPDYATSEMARSLQTGLRALEPHYHAAIVALADQPHIRPATVEAVLQRWRETLAPMVAPFHAGKRGHPLLFDRAQWPQVLALPADANPRAVLQTTDGLEAVEIASDTILNDIDTPADYARLSADRDKH